MASQQELVMDEVVASLKEEAAQFFGNAPAEAKRFVEEYFRDLQEEAAELVKALAANDDKEADRRKKNIDFIIGNVQGKILQLALIAKTQFSLQTLLTVAGNVVMKLAPQLIALL